MKEQEIFDHIEAGRHQELYPEWAKTGTWSVRYKLARKGYELDIVINKDIISLENINIFIGETQPSG